MAATVAFVSGTTITALRTPTTGNTATGAGSAGNVPQLLTINPLDFTGGSNQGMAAIPDEIMQFINICATGDATNAVAGWGMDWFSTALFIEKCMQAIISKGAPSSYNPV